MSEFGRMSIADRKMLIALWNQGESQQTIGETLGRTARSIQWWRHELGLQPRCAPPVESGAIEVVRVLKPMLEGIRFENITKAECRTITANAPLSGKPPAPEIRRPLSGTSASMCTER